MTNNIRIERLKLGLTQEELADRLDVSRQTVNALEKGKYCPSTILALKLSRLFGIPVNDFFSLDETD
ncbi:MAG: helix-turn-helix transcriptional regulator [Bacteroidales bacterium]|jgi:putative transcriptional regulator|nr:helix-turn-helix transcriptional regulator [Bacteroidales bacterium]